MTTPEKLLIAANSTTVPEEGVPNETDLCPHFQAAEEEQIKRELDRMAEDDYVPPSAIDWDAPGCPILQ